MAWYGLSDPGYEGSPAALGPTGFVGSTPPASTAQGGSNMAWVAPAIGAIAQLGTAGYGAYSQNQAANQRPNQQQIPLPPYQEALQAITARALALNMMQTPPSFVDFVNSGGQARFPMINPGMTPMQMRNLGIVGPTGGPIPFSYAPGGTPVGTQDFSAGTGPAPPGGLSDLQKLYFGMQQARQGQKGVLASAYKAHQLQKQLGQKLQQLNTRELAPGIKVGKLGRIEATKERVRKRAEHAKRLEVAGFGHALPGESRFDTMADVTFPRGPMSPGDY